MHKSNIVLSIAGVALLLLGALVVTFVRAHASSTATSSRSSSSHLTLTTSTTHLQLGQLQTEAARQQTGLKPAVVSKPKAVPSAKPAAVSVPTAVPTQPGQPQGIAPTPVPSGPAPAPVGSGSDRYYPIGTAAATMKAEATNLTKQQVKTLIESQVNANWAVIQSKLGFSTEADGYAFFLGLATRESTLNAGLETGSGAGHSYGAIQAAETAYANANPNYAPENDVPEMTQYDFTPENFYDPGIAVHMGIRHLLHFATQAKAAGYTGTELLRHALIGYNTGWVTDSDASWLQQYSDEIGAIAGWYLNNGHLYDTQFTWTGSSAVDRSSPWGWYL